MLYGAMEKKNALAGCDFCEKLHSFGAFIVILHHHHYILYQTEIMLSPTEILVVVKSRRNDVVFKSRRNRGNHGNLY